MNKKDYKIGIYIRTDQKDNNAVKEQENLNVSYCNYRGYKNIVKKYIDNGKSGITENRPAYKRLLKDVRCGNINVIVVTDLSRLTRQPAYFYSKLTSYIIEEKLLIFSVMDGNISKIKLINDKNLINYIEIIKKYELGGVK